MPGGGDFNAGDEAQTMAPCTMLGFLEASHRIVIGERQYFDPGRRGARDQFGRSQRAVRAVRMGVQVDIEAAVAGFAAHEGLPASPTASSRSPASTMKPCARSKPSLV